MNRIKRPPVLHLPIVITATAKKHPCYRTLAIVGKISAYVLFMSDMLPPSIILFYILFFLPSTPSSHVIVHRSPNSLI